jgi:hypothetical protein
LTAASFASGGKGLPWGGNLWFNDAGSRISPGASGEFGSHAIRPRSGHHVLAMTVMVEVTVKLLPSSQRKLGSSVFRRAPVTPADAPTSIHSYSQIRTIDFRDCLIKLTQSLLRIQSQAIQNRIAGDDTGIRITTFI